MQRDLSVNRVLLDACLTGARAGAEFIRSQSGRLADIDWKEKSRADFVSDVDTGAEQRITDALLRVIPGATVLGEELTPRGSPGSGVTFIVDPLDGTTNFLHGYPQYAVSIACVADGAVLAGVVIDVPRDATFTATRGGGAFCDTRPLHVSRITEPLRALIGTGFPFKHPQFVAPYIAQLARIVSSTAGVRRAGSAALDLADVATGRFEGFWELMLAPWDMAAGLLLISEAGGRVSDLEGRPLEPSHSAVVASNGHLHDWLLDQLRAPGEPVTLPS